MKITLVFTFLSSYTCERNSRGEGSNGLYWLETRRDEPTRPDPTGWQSRVNCRWGGRKQVEFRGGRWMLVEDQRGVEPAGGLNTRHTLCNWIKANVRIWTHNGGTGRFWCQPTAVNDPTYQLKKSWMLCWPRMDWRRRAGAPHCNPHGWKATTEVMLLAGDELLLIWQLNPNFNVKEISIPPRPQTTHTWAAAAASEGPVWYVDLWVKEVFLEV